MNVTEIQSRIQNAKTLDFGTIFNQSIELFKKVWVQGLVTVLLQIVLAIPIVMVLYIPLLFMGLLDAFSGFGSYDSNFQTSISIIAMIVMFVLYIFAIAAMSTIAFGLQAAFYRICKLKDLEQIGREDYFYFFKKPYLSKTIKLGLANMGIALVAALLCVLPIIYIIVPLYFMYVVYAFNPDKSVSEIIKLSFDLGNKKWFITFGLLVVSIVLAVTTGFLMCMIGVYVTRSFIFLPLYVIYKEVIGFDEKSEQMKRIEQLSIL